MRLGGGRRRSGRRILTALLLVVPIFLPTVPRSRAALPTLASLCPTLFMSSCRLRSGSDMLGRRSRLDRSSICCLGILRSLALGGSINLSASCSALGSVQSPGDLALLVPTSLGLGGIRRRSEFLGSSASGGSSILPLEIRPLLRIQQSASGGLGGGSGGAGGDPLCSIGVRLSASSVYPKILGMPIGYCRSPSQRPQWIPVSVRSVQPP